MFFLCFFIFSCSELEKQYFKSLPFNNSKNSKKIFLQVYFNEERAGFEIPSPDSYNQLINNHNLLEEPAVQANILIDNSYIKDKKKNQFFKIKNFFKKKSKIKKIYLPLPSKFEDLLLDRKEILLKKYIIRENKINFIKFEKNNVSQKISSTPLENDFFKISSFIFKILSLRFINLEKIYFIHPDDLYNHS